MKSVVDLGGGSKVVFDWSKFSDVRKLGQSVALEEGEKLARRAESYPQPAATKKYRARKGAHISAVVQPATPHAYNSNAKHNTLMKVLGEARG